jgi:hypothetical protein
MFHSFPIDPLLLKDMHIIIVEGSSFQHKYSVRTPTHEQFSPITSTLSNVGDQSGWVVKTREMASEDVI